MDNPDKHLLARIGQYAIIKNPENKILLLKRKRSGNWSLPGGRLNKKDKDWKAALIREVKEETNLEIENLKPLDIKLIEDEFQVKYCVYFTCECKDVSKLKISDEHSGHKWVDKTSIESLTLDEEPHLREVLSNYFSQKTL